MPNCEQQLSEEGKLFWVDMDELIKLNLADGFGERLPMFLEDKYTEGFGTWNDKGSSEMRFLWGYKNNLYEYILSEWLGKL